VDIHTYEKCWKLHLELHLKWYKSKKGAMKTTNMEEIEVEGNFDVDEILVCTILQQRRKSGERSALL
jgi:hypothetical protein